MLEVETSGYSESDTTDHGYDKRFKCTQPNCKASFSKNSKLVVHMRRHTGERPFTCEEEGCGKSYTNMSHLKRHKKAFHYKLNTEAVLCPYPGCGIELTNKWNLKKHQLRKHNPLRKFPFPCPDCEQGFLRKRKLQEHSYIHTGVPVFKCEVCQMNFTTYNEFTKHKRHHKMYTCECKKEFGLWSVLLAHKKKCDTQRAICDVCNKALANKATLAIHRKIHLNIDEKPLYECNYAECYRYYHHKRNLFHHISSFHLKETSDNLQLPCTHEGCGQLFKGMVYLRRHLKTQHGTTPEVNKPRRPRRDKGMRKKQMSSILTGEGLSEHEQPISSKTRKRKRTKKESYVSEESTTEHDSPISKNRTNETITSIPSDENGQELDKPALTLSTENITNPDPPDARTRIDSDASLDEILQNCDATLKIIEETLTRNGKVNCVVESKDLSQVKISNNEMIES